MGSSPGSVVGLLADGPRDGLLGETAEPDDVAVLGVPALADLLGDQRVDAVEHLHERAVVLGLVALQVRHSRRGARQAAALAGRRRRGRPGAVAAVRAAARAVLPLAVVAAHRLVLVAVGGLLGAGVAVGMRHLLGGAVVLGDVRSVAVAVRVGGAVRVDVVVAVAGLLLRLADALASLLAALVVAAGVPGAGASELRGGVADVAHDLR